MRVLIINFFYPPVVDAHAYRWEQIARYWVEQGYEVDVIAGRLHGVTNHSVQNGVNVSRVGIGSRALMHSSAARQSAVKRCKWLYSSARTMLRFLYRKVYWPDAWWYWWPYAAFEALRRRHLNYDLVVSYSPCLGAHLAAAILTRRSKTIKSIWIADYGDPFSTSLTMPPNNFALYGQLNRIVEKSIAKRADALVFTNADTAVAYRDAGIYASGRAQIIPHLADVRRLYADGPRHRPSGAPDVIHLLYIGGFHRGIREPDLLFDIVRRLNRNDERDYVLTIYGPANGFNLSPVDCPYIRYKGMVCREKAIGLIQDADVLINVENMNCVMTPSKVVEYVATGRPLLNVGGSGIDNPILSQYVKSGFAMGVRQEDLLSDDIYWIAQFLSRIAGVIAPLETVEQVLGAHTLTKVAEQYLTLMSEAQQEKVFE